MKYNPIIQAQFREVIEKYPSMMLHWEGEFGIVEGELYFSATYNGVLIEDTYNITIIIPPNYPNELPLTKEIGNRIPDSFHKLGNGFLCLEVNTKLKIEFLQNPTLLFYIDKFLIEYLYGFSHKELYGHLPYGERPHYALGIVDFYKELLNVEEIKVILNFLQILSTGNYRGHHFCPCNSNKKIRDCHGEKIKQLINLNIQENYRNDLKQIMDYAKYVRFNL